MRFAFLFFVALTVLTCNQRKNLKTDIKGLWMIEGDSTVTSSDMLYVEFSDSVLQFYQHDVGYLPPSSYLLTEGSDSLLTWRINSVKKDTTVLGKITEMHKDKMLILNSTRLLVLRKISEEYFEILVGEKWIK